MNLRHLQLNSCAFITAGLSLFLSLVVLDTLAQRNGELQVGAYAGLQLGAFQNTGYRSSPDAGWKAGLQISSDLNRTFRLTAEAGVSFLQCAVGDPMLPASIRWKYLWAEASPLISYLPVKRNNFNVAIGTGMSFRRLLDANTGSPYPWTYFLPVRLSGEVVYANLHRLTFAVEYAVQLREMYHPTEVSSSTINKLDRMYSLGLIISYSIPGRNKA